MVRHSSLRGLLRKVERLRSVQSLPSRWIVQSDMRAVDPLDAIPARTAWREQRCAAPPVRQDSMIQISI